MLKSIGLIASSRGLRIIVSMIPRIEQAGE